MAGVNRLQESIMRDPELGKHVWEQYLQRAAASPIYKKLLAEGLYSDVAGALGAVQDVVWMAAQPKCVGRELVRVVPTKNALERFPKDVRAYAWIGEVPPLGTGSRVEMQDVRADLEISSKKEWTESFVEDASWDVLQWQIENMGLAVARIETEKIIAAYNALANADLATGAEVAITDGAPTWAQVCDLINAVQREDFTPTVIAMNPHEFGGLMKLDQFVNSLYADPEKTLRKGVFYHTKLDITFVSSSLVSKSLCVDTNAAAVLLVRRDLTSKPYEDPSRNMYGVMVSQRIGVGVLRTKGVARGTN
jgi:hypothetical protein